MLTQTLMNPDFRRSCSTKLTLEVQNQVHLVSGALWLVQIIFKPRKHTFCRYHELTMTAMSMHDITSIRLTRASCSLGKSWLVRPDG